MIVFTDRIQSKDFMMQNNNPVMRLLYAAFNC